MITIGIFAEDKPGVLYKIADIFLKRKINIESLTVSKTERKGISRFTITVNTDKETVEKISKQLYRIIEVVKVFEAEDKELVYSELAFLKISATNPLKRREIEDLVELYNGKVVFVDKDSILVQKVGREEEIDSMLNLLKPYGIKEVVRTGRIAVLKSEEKLKGKFEKILPSPSYVAKLELSAIKALEHAGRNIKGSISLAQGTPDFLTPNFIKDSAKKAMEKSLTDKYTSGYGIDELRKAIAEKVRRDNKIKADYKNVMVTHGATEALIATFMGVFNPKDEVIVITPDYASHITQISLARYGGRPVFVSMEEKEGEWVLNLEKLESAVNHKTKGILICNPSNPTGKVFSREELKGIADIALRHNLFIITDEIYEYFVFGGKEHISIASFEEVADRTISIFGVSKAYAMTGWRIGYIVADERVLKEVFKVHDALVNCPAVVSQYAALSAIKSGPEVPKKFAKEYERRRKIVVEELSKTDKIVLPKMEGAYYAFPKIKDVEDDYEFAFRVLERAKVAVVPGSAFGKGGGGHVRISYCKSEEELREGLRRLVEYVENNRRMSNYK